MSKSSLDKLADHVSKEAMKEDVPLCDKVEALKILTAVEALRLKHKVGEEDTSDSTMSGLMRKIKDAENGQPVASSRRGN